MSLRGSNTAWFNATTHSSLCKETVHVQLLVANVECHPRNNKLDVESGCNTCYMQGRSQR